MQPLKHFLLSLLLLLFVSSALAGLCEIDDNGTGTINLPPDCPDGYIGILNIIEGLPPGSTITGEAILTDIYGQSTIPGGILGGEGHAFGATLHWTATGTDMLSGFQRQLAIPVDCEMHSAPRTPGDPVQIFANDMIFLHGQITGDPDFSNLDIIAGDGTGLPSPGSTTLTELPGGGSVALDIFDIRGRHVCNLVDAVQDGGLKSVTWYGNDARGKRTSSGVYLYTLKTDRQTLVRKMVVLK